MRKSLIGATAALLIPLAVGCAPSTLSCAAEPAPSSATVRWLEAEHPQFDGATAELCAGDSCVREKPASQDIVRLSVDIPEDSAGSRMKIRLRVFPSGAKEPAIDRSITVLPKKRADVCGEPGGSGVMLDLTSDGELTTKISATGKWDPGSYNTPPPPSSTGAPG
ncbi:hypothetical protein [Streptomyces sp. NPDC093109]|uniref:hypothetical protein n=1 Tax=Streptomyces sp. NPDC093109 TaxID=3154977 RepID=UPI00344F38FB